MCTISYYPYQNGGFTLTDNRDESVARPADSPRVYREYHTKLWYPKDRIAGGTWFGVAENNRVLCLMNGAFKPHQSMAQYKKSRGVMVKELLSNSMPFEKVIKQYDFLGIEPFFALWFEWCGTAVSIYELVWDGSNLFFEERPAHLPRLWSSVMTYSAEQHQNKVHQFKQYIAAQKTLTAQKLWRFHHVQHEKGLEDMVIDRGQLQTTSITQFTYASNCENNFGCYEDLLSNELTEGEIKWSCYV